MKPTSQSNWNLSLIYKNDSDPKISQDRKMTKKLSSEFISRWKNTKDYLKNPKTLKKALDEYNNWLTKCGNYENESYYYHLKSSLNQIDPTIKAKVNQIDDLSMKLYNEMSFFMHRISKIPEIDQKKIIESKDLTEYKHLLEKLFEESKYLLSEPEEKILVLKTKTSYSNWVEMLSSFLSKETANIIDEDGKTKRKSYSEISELLSHHKKEVRDSANKSFCKILEKYSDVAEAEINSILMDKKTNDELRKFTRPDHSRHLSDDIDTNIVDQLVTTTALRFDIPKRYYELKAKLMKVDKLKYHERNVQVGNINITYTYEETIELLNNVFGDISPDFKKIFESFVVNGQIDAYPKENKSSGAFCTHNGINQPTYILLNHTNKLNDVLTFAHEVGHGINNELIRKNQKAIYFGTPTSTAEVASTFMEDFVLQKILKDSNDESRFNIMMTKLNDDISTIFRQIACYRFEFELHKEFIKRGYLPKEKIGKMFQIHMKEYMGDFVEQSKGSENFWIAWSHIRSFFYVYSYASGLLISKSLQKSVKKNPEFINKVKTFLSAGESDSPKNIFKKLEIDISKKEFWTTGINEIEELLLETEKLAKKLNKI